MTKYVAGERIKSMREEAGLSTSRFVSLVGIESEKELIDMENNITEADDNILSKIAKVFGGSLEGLRHGDKAKYDIGGINYSNIYEAKKSFDQYSSNYKICVTLDKEKKRIGYILTDVNWYFKPYTVSFGNIGINEWVQDFIEISKVYRFMEEMFVSQHYKISGNGIIISSQEHDDIYSGRKYAKNVIGDKIHSLGYWYDDMVCLENDPAKMVELYSEWFAEVQAIIKDCLEASRKLNETVNESRPYI